MTADPLTTLESARLRYLEILLDFDALRFGDFTTKSGRRSPYFIDSGRLNSGRAIQSAAECYAALIQSLAGPPVDILFGPAYKGIPLAVATSEALSRATQRDTGWLFNRKEAKDHGEGGLFVGRSPRPGERLVVIEDVLTAGTSLRETLPLLRRANARATDLVIGIDREEHGSGARPASLEIADTFGLQVHSLLTITRVIDILSTSGIGRHPPLDARTLGAIADYRARFPQNH
jgi:orotate phosphoribosyltransferase